MKITRAKNIEVNGLKFALYYKTLSYVSDQKLKVYRQYSLHYGIYKYCTTLDTKKGVNNWDSVSIKWATDAAKRMIENFGIKK